MSDKNVGIHRPGATFAWHVLTRFEQRQELHSKCRDVSRTVGPLRAETILCIYIYIYTHIIIIMIIIVAITYILRGAQGGAPNELSGRHDPQQLRRPLVLGDLAGGAPGEPLV